MSQCFPWWLWVAQKRSLRTHLAGRPNRSTRSLCPPPVVWYWFNKVTLSDAIFAAPLFCWRVLQVYYLGRSLFRWPRREWWRNGGPRGTRAWTRLSSLGWPCPLRKTTSEPTAFNRSSRWCPQCRRQLHLHLRQPHLPHPTIILVRHHSPAKGSSSFLLREIPKAGQLVLTRVGRKPRKV